MSLLSLSLEFLCRFKVCLQTRKQGDQNLRPYDSLSALDSGGSGSLRATKLRASSGNFEGSSMMLVFEQSFASLRNASFRNCCKDIRSPSQSIELDCISCGLMLDTSCAKEWTKWPMMDVKTQYRQSLCVRCRTWSANMSGMDFPLLETIR